MTRGAIAVVVCGTLFVAVLVGWLVTRPDPRVVQPTTVLVAPPETPLRDSIREPARKKATKKRRRVAVPKSSQSQKSRPDCPGVPLSVPCSLGATRKSPTRPGPRTRPEKRKTTGSKPQGSSQPQSPPQSSPSPQPEPQPGITVPLPTVCIPKVTC
jgi:hypothetical protein